MNITAINTMIDTFIRLDKAPLPEHPDRGFNMRSVFSSGEDFTSHQCGTAACLSGWSQILFGGRMLFQSIKYSDNSGNSLTMPEPRKGCIYHYARDAEKFTLRAAIRVLQILRDTGEVNWNEAIANPWTPDEEAPAKPSFKADDWLDSILGNSDDMAVPLLEGPKREFAK